MADTGPVFVDSNVFVYALTRPSDPRHARARDVIETLAVAERGRISVQVLGEVANVLTRKLRPPRPVDEVIERLRDLETWHPHRPAVDDVAAALRLTAERSLSFWDAMIVRSAQALGCSLLLSEDLQDGAQVGSLRIENPFRDLAVR